MRSGNMMKGGSSDTHIMMPRYLGGFRSFLRRSVYHRSFSFALFFESNT